ncbi:MAG: flagellar M-ring protein FliF C-terminal domain-containing protein [Tepidisphaeraceae bacterium]
MDFLKGQLDKIQQQLGGLNASQRMLTGSLVAIMVMTLVWWGRYAGTAEMEPVLPQSFSASDGARITGHLKSIGITTKLDGDRVLVPADRRDEALASLAFAELMPENSVSGFDEISKQLSPWDGQSKTEAYMKEGKQRTLQAVIREFPGVKDATVILEPVTTRRINAPNDSSAMISITMKDGGEGSRKIAHTAAQLVAGAQQNLLVKNTRVAIGGKHYRIKGDDGTGGGDAGEIRELLADHERYFEDKVQDLYPYIDGLFIKVSVHVNLTSTQTQSKTFDKVMQKERTSNTRAESEPVPGPGAAEPGAAANLGASIDQATPQAIAGEKTREENETDFENFADTKTEVSSKPAGDPTVLSAAVGVPRSFFVKAYKTMSASTAEPTQAALLPIIESESEKFRSAVVASTAIQDPSRVVVSVYDDSPPPLIVSAAAVPSGSLASALGDHGKEIAIGALALISLFMVSMMVRKSTPAPIIAAAPESRETPQLDGMGEVAGIVGEGDSLLDGMELDEDAVRTQQMLDQVQTMVAENPDAAANLVKRWLNRT